MSSSSATRTAKQQAAGQVGIVPTKRQAQRTTDKPHDGIPAGLHTRLAAKQLTEAPPATVLLIEDDQEIRHVAALRLQAAGYNTRDATDGERGVRQAIEELPDVIVLDVRMPKKDGMTALAELKAHEATRDIPVVMLSASIVDQQQALDAGARFFLTKPYRGQDLLAMVSGALTGQPMLRSNRRVDPKQVPLAKRKWASDE